MRIKTNFIITLTLLCLFSLPCHAENASSTIQQLYQQHQTLSHQSLTERIEFFSARFLGKPYLLGALGEGNSGYFDTYPLYRTDAFDCETYVDTVLALAFAHNLTTFEQYIRQIRYQTGKVSFVHRNHFTCLDWNQNNQKQGFVEDITTTFKNRKGTPIAQYAKALIDKPSWYQHMSIQRIRIKNSPLTEREKRLGMLKQRTRHLPVEISTIPYLPFSALFDTKGRANHYVLKQIPNAAIIEIIRPNWDLSQTIGTHLNVSHLGFAIWRNGILYFRETSSLDGRALDVPLVDYLQQTRQSPTIQGINIQIARAPRPSCQQPART